MRPAALGCGVALLASGCSGTVAPLAYPFPDAAVGHSLAVAFLAPVPEAVLDGASVEVEVVIQSVGAPVTSAALTLDGDDGGISQPGNSTPGWEIALTPYSPGPHRLVVEASNSLGDQASAARMVVIPAPHGGTTGSTGGSTSGGSTTGSSTGGSTGGSTGTGGSGCTIDGAAFDSGATNPTNPCQICQPAKSSSAFQPISGFADGGCPSGQVCLAGVCSTGCWIDNAFMAAGSSIFGDSCQQCLPSETVTSWTPVTGPAPNGGSCTAGQVCHAGACGAGCYLGGSFYNAGAADPQHPCRSCRPSTSTRVWVNDFSSSSIALGGLASALVAIDLNKDGRPDLAVELSGSTIAYLSQGDGGFLAGGGASIPGTGSAGAVIPYTNPPNPDIFIANGTSQFYDAKSNGLGGFVACRIAGITVTPCNIQTQGLQLTALTAGDFAGNGRLDLAAADFGNLAVLYYMNPDDFENNSPKTFSLGLGATTLALGLASGDFNGDGRADSAVASLSLQGSPSINRKEAVQLWLAQPDGGFSAAGSYKSAAFLPWQSSVAQLTVADFDGDGKLDVAIPVGDNGLAVVFGDGAGGLSRSEAVATGSGPVGLVAGDFNGDGWPDLAIANSGDKNIGILFNQGDGTFAPQVVFATPGSPSALAGSGWTAPAVGASYGSPTSLLGAVDGSGNLISLVNSCR